MGSWVSMPMMPTPRGGLAASSLGHGALLAIGGRRGREPAAWGAALSGVEPWNDIAKFPFRTRELDATRDIYTICI